MQEWRADPAAPPPATRLPDAPTGRRRGGSYSVPPASIVKTLTLGEVLPPTRPIPTTQQERLGFVGGHPRGPSLWLAGDASLLARPCVAIVGTRDVSELGAARARRLARELSQEGVVVVSGLAKGVDTEALTSAIASGGRVIAVVGTPVDKAYPAENKRLQERIYREHLLVSQFEPGSRVFPGNFPTRNKLMAALSDATVIIEASDTSGTLHQAAKCVDLGRWLFIAKSVFEDPTVRWPADFRGYRNVRALSDTAEVLEVLGLSK